MRVEAVAHRIVVRRRVRLDGAVDAQVSEAVELLRGWGALDPGPGPDPVDAVPPAPGDRGEAVAVVVEPGRVATSRQLLGAAAQLAVDVDGHVVALSVEAPDPATLGSWGADAIVHLEGSTVAEDLGGALAAWVRVASPWAVLAPSTTWGREVMGRAAAGLDAGLIGGATTLAVDGAGRLRAQQPVLSGQQLAVLTTSSPVQLATVRPGALATRAVRASGGVEILTMTVDRALPGADPVRASRRRPGGARQRSGDRRRRGRRPA